MDSPTADEAHAVPDHDVRRIAVAESIRNGMWFLPTMAMAGAAVVAIVLIQLDQRTGVEGALSFRGDAGVAQVLLTTVAGATLTMTTLVVTITIVALQLASQQFSPRVMRTFFRDTGTKVAIGIFLATTAYALLVLRAVHPAEGSKPAEVPELAITVAFGLMLASLVTLLYFLNHVAHSIRAVHIMESVAAETRRAIREQDRLPSPPDPDRPDRPADLVITSEQPPGALLGYDEDDLVALAARHRVRIRLLPYVGDYLPSGIPLAEVWADDGSEAPLTLRPAEVVAYVGIGRERTMRQDVAFGFRQLVDIAEKALSPAVNDPTTGVQALNRIHDLLRRLAVAPEPRSLHRDPAGRVRLDVPVHGWDDLVHLAIDEVRQYGGNSLQVHRLLRSILLDLRRVVEGPHPERVAVLDLELDLLERTAARAFPDAEDQAWVAVPIYQR